MRNCLWDFEVESQPTGMGDLFPVKRCCDSGMLQITSPFTSTLKCARVLGKAALASSGVDLVGSCGKPSRQKGHGKQYLIWDHC